MTGWYREDLAYIHDVGFGDHALESAPGILEVLARSGIRDGLVVDLGCGSGLWARELANAGYRVLGIDISEAMSEIARRRVPEAEFRVGSLFGEDIPPCGAVTSVGEVFNYLFDPPGDDMLPRIFRRVYDALAPGGVFVFDVAEPGQVRGGTPAKKNFTEGEDWMVLVESEEDPERGTLTRRITSFRRVGAHYRRDDELHSQRLYESRNIARELRRAGFRVRTTRRYGEYRLPRAHVAFVVRKPA